MTQWDYLRVDIIFGQLGSHACYVDGDPADVPELTGVLANKPDRDRLFHGLGSKGWELTTATPLGHGYEYMFRRPRGTSTPKEA